MKPTIGIIGGCGHVGLPLGISLARAGAQVTLIDVSHERVKEVAAGHMPFLEYGADEVLREVLASGHLRVTTTADTIAESDNVIVTIGTPVDEFLDPSVRSFDRELEKLLERMRSGQLLILRSTVFPGVTERLARQVADRQLQIDIAHCPERIAQGYAMQELCKLPQLVGGVTPAATRRASALFSLLGVPIIELAPVEAELAKLFSNAYRYLNFAVANQFYMLTQKFGADFHRIHHAVTHNYPRMVGFPRAGFTGGPCLLKDTMQLSAFNHNQFALGQAAMMVNEGLPSALVDAVKSRQSLHNVTAGILGMAFKGDSDDPRDSLAYKLRKVLLLECRQVLCTDPHIRDPEFVDIDTVLRDAEIIFLGACHQQYRDLVITKPVVDVFNFLRGSVGPQSK